MINDDQVDHFHRQGFFLLETPFGGEQMSALKRRQREIEPLWVDGDFPEGYNRGACQFLLMGEMLLQLVEQPELLAMARRLLDCDEIHVGACGLGDAGQTVAAGKSRHQVHWHADGGPEVKQVSLRTALDFHGPDNGPLRVLPGSHLRARAEVAEELRHLEWATGKHEEESDEFFAVHPHEVAVHLHPRWTLVWTPSAWHATGVKTAIGPRRAMAWNYFPLGGRRRDSEAVKHIYADEWRSWTGERQQLWGLLD
ncbi:MAG: phytanoyl-CoA dioxygenase family protein [Candidatus Latescibacteria bacterium]|nr:phytanoyl-CoA dioxygenase family protein [Candidatus Latescibacterota bacterium]